jgi:hypothetical protein
MAWQPQKLVSTETIDGYQIARPALYGMQRGKCCYCERVPEEKWQDTEHFRPKVFYWWLAWTWENLLFSCKNCNTPKLTRFPLRTQVCLQPYLTSPTYGDQPSGTEQPLLINPADPGENPLQHIQFRPDGYGGWRPWPRKGSRRGAEMIRSCELDRTDLRERYDQRASEFEDAIARIKEAAPTHLPTIWASVQRRWLGAHTPFAALHHDMLDHYFPTLYRQKHHLDLSINYPP